MFKSDIYCKMYMIIVYDVKCKFHDEKTAQMIISKCKIVNWDIRRISYIIEENKVKLKNYTQVNGYYMVEKKINGEGIVFCRLKEESEAIYLVEELRKTNWNLSKVDEILCKIGIN